MEASKLEQYMTERNQLSATIAKSIIKAIASHVKELPEEALEDLGSAIHAASGDVSDCIFEILAEDQCECGCDE